MKFIYEYNYSQKYSHCLADDKRNCFSACFITQPSYELSFTVCRVGGNSSGILQICSELFFSLGVTDERCWIAAQIQPLHFCGQNSTSPSVSPSSVTLGLVSWWSSYLTVWNSKAKLSLFDQIEEKDGTGSWFVFFVGLCVRKWIVQIHWRQHFGIVYIASGYKGLCLTYDTYRVVCGVQIFKPKTQHLCNKTEAIIRNTLKVICY